MSSPLQNSFNQAATSSPRCYGKRTPGAVHFDSNSIIADLDERGANVVISQHPRRSQPRKIDLEIYKWRHLIENFFGKLKEFKRIAMRADKTDQSFGAMIHLAAAVISSR
ncbi:hypothetical protein MSC49_40350 (plasmid) [Methylosinus sp. C49]|uniref:transposase n=1 Tax=Methylosinus sp. C49 TaxID=2699395 RepID=UPI001366AEAD|nr:transposase [Methylosinus sp. C49]BBU64100.1 hypothetical protein MSC49_40350 [Methylosinus sp. C49]